MSVEIPLTIVRKPLAVTGIGVYSPIGKDPQEFWSRIANCECGVKEIRGFCTDGLSVRHAAEIADHNPLAYFDSQEELSLDWTAQFGIIAARQAMDDACLDSRTVNSTRLGLVVGVCAGGQGDSPLQRSIDRPFEIALDRFPETSIYRQTDAIGRVLQIHGPRNTVSTACASSGSALGYAYELLQTGDVDAILVGGTDAFSISTYAGFYALGAMPTEPISPFSENIGVSFGEGSGFVVVESLERAESRGAKIYGLLLGYGCSGDAHHVTSPHPSGEGLQRAMELALTRSSLNANQIDYVNAHGTATRDNDRAETSAIREVFKKCSKTPPVSSSKSQFGHTLGAAGILEFIVSILAQQEKKIPATVNFAAARPGCDLDYVPNECRFGEIDGFLSNSAAFGGINVSVAGGSLKYRDAITRSPVDEIWITGVGVVSPIGCGLEEFRHALLEGRTGIAPITEFDVAERTSQFAALMGDFKARKRAPTIDVRRTDPLNRFAMVAAALALKHSRLNVNAQNSGRIGMVMSLNYGSIAVQERFRDSLMNDGIDKLSAKHFPSMVVSTVGGTVAQSFGLRGYNSTVVDGIGSGLQGLIHAYHVLRQDEHQDAIVVTAADEVGALLFKIFDQRGWLAPTTGVAMPVLGPYQSDAGGWILGEGAVSLVIERASKARERGARPLAKIAGCGLTADAALAPQFEENCDWHVAAIENSLRNGRLSLDDIDLVYGHGRGVPQHDLREVRALNQVFGDRAIPLGCIVGNTGMAGATSGLYSVVASLLSIQYGEGYPVIGSSGDLVHGMKLNVKTLRQPFSNVLVTGSTENGNNAAIVVSQVEE